MAGEAHYDNKIQGATSLDALATEAERVKNPIGPYRGIKIARYTR